MRIVSGRFRGRLLVAPEGRDEVRPTSDRTRESVFNILAHRFQGSGFFPADTHVIDVFAGTGAMGLEALSRGAAHVTFLEKGASALAALRRNIQNLGVHGETDVLVTDASHPPPARRAALVAFLDPPYAKAACLSRTLTGLASQGWLRSGAVCVCETAWGTSEDRPPPDFELKDIRRYGKARIAFLRYCPQSTLSLVHPSSSPLGGGSGAFPE